MSIARKDVDAICSALPGAVLGVPPKELAAWKVGGKMFATFGDFGDDDGVSVKCADVETASMLIDAGAAERAPYFHKSWVRLPFDATPRDDIKHRVYTSYDIVRASLTKKFQATLPARQEA